MIPDRFPKMFAGKLIVHKACGPTRSEYAQLLFVWVYRERRVRFYVISAPLKSGNPCYNPSNNNFSLLCAQLRDRSESLLYACAEVLHSLNNKVQKRRIDALPFLPLCHLFDGLSPDTLRIVWRHYSRNTDRNAM